MCYNKNINDLKGGFFMANRSKIGLVTLNDRVVLFSKEEEEIIKFFKIDEVQLKNEIDNIMEKKISRPAEIFKEAVEVILFPYKFLDLRKKVKIYGEEISIHEQEIFKRWREYISSSEKYIESEKRRTSDRKKKCLYEKNIIQQNLFTLEVSEKIRKKRNLY